MIALVAEGMEKAELAFQHVMRAGETFSGEACRQHAAFRGAPEMQPLDHPAGTGARKLDESAG